MKKWLMITVLLTLHAVTPGCQKKIENSWDTCQHDVLYSKPLEMETVFLQIEKESAGFVSMKDLRKSKSFMLLFDAPVLYQPEIFNLLISEKVSLTRKMWLVESQCKCDAVYYHFCSAVIGLYKTGKLGQDSESILMELLAPANSSTLPFLKSENTKFQLLLHDLKEVKNLPVGLTSFISDVEAGYVLQNWSLYY